MTRNDSWIGVVILLLSVTMFYQASTMEYANFGSDPGPTLVPKIISVILFVCSIALILWPKLKSEVAKEENSAERKANWTKMIVVGAALIVYTFLLNLIGFVVSTILFLAFSIWFLAKEKSLKLVLVSIVTSLIVTGTIYYLFRHLLKILLP